MIFRCLSQKIVSGVALVLSSSPIGPVVDHPISLVVDHLGDLALWEAEFAADPGGVDPLSVVSSLLDRLRQVPDPRRLRVFGIRCW